MPTTDKLLDRTKLIKAHFYLDYNGIEMERNDFLLHNTASLCFMFYVRHKNEHFQVAVQTTLFRNSDDSEEVIANASKEAIRILKKWGKETRRKLEWVQDGWSSIHIRKPDEYSCQAIPHSTSMPCSLCGKPIEKTINGVLDCKECFYRRNMSSGDYQLWRTTKFFSAEFSLNECPKCKNLFTPSELRWEPNDPDTNVCFRCYDEAC